MTHESSENAHASHSSGRLVLLLGPSGVGKSRIKAFLEGDYHFASAPKYTTRPRRSTEFGDAEFIFVDCVEDIPSHGILLFESYGHVFGIQLEAIDESLSNGRDHVVVLGDQETVNALTTRYPMAVRTILVYCARGELRHRTVELNPDRKHRWPAVEAELNDIYDTLAVAQDIVDNSGSFSATAMRLRNILGSPPNDSNAQKGGVTR